MTDANQIADDLRGTFRGRLAFDPITRGLYSTDASPFQVMPLGVACPQDTDDLATLVRYCYEHSLPMIARGAGTGVAGESLGPGLIIDLSPNFRRILDIGSDTITAEPGVVCAELNTALARHGRRFAPDLASRGSCTVGGMVATNASGGNAFRYGYTRDYIRSLGVVWDDGSIDSVGEARSETARTADLSQAVAGLLAAHRDLIHIARPDTSFDRCGYLLHDLLTEGSPDLARLLTGSEGTLGFITRASFRTVPLPGGTCVALLGFPTLDAAVQSGLELRAFDPVSCDLLDRRLLSLTRHSGPAQAVGLIPPSVGAALIIAFEDDTERAATERAWGAVERLRESHRLGVLAEPTCDPEGIGRIRGVREAAVAGLYALGKGPRPAAFIEDIGVPANALPEFLAKSQDVLKRFELSGSFLIHVLTGQVHTRPLVDLESPADRAKLWPLAEAVNGIVLTLGGTVSSQHGTGIARTPWVERQVGPLMPLFRELKLIFDPKNVLNPGKIVGPDPSRPAWPLRQPGSGERGAGSDTEPQAGTATVSDAGLAPPPPGTPTPETRYPILVWSSDGPAAEAAKCTGCGDCRSQAQRGRMCPVFRETGDEIATPRAMANAFRLIGSPADLASDKVKALADRCIHCRMCRDECPAKVDASKLMLEAKAARQAEHGLDRADWVLARTESFATLGSNFAPVLNWLLGRRSVRWVLEKVFGVARRRRLPAFALRTFFRQARGLGLTRSRVAGHPSGVGVNPRTLAPGVPAKVAYFTDVFANYNDPLIGVATVAVLRHHDIEVYVPPRQVGCGMAALAQGDVETAREAAVRNVRAMADLARHGYRIVCSEPTAALMLSQDYPDLLNDADAAAVAANTTELTAFLWDLHQAGRLKTRFRRLDLTLGHHVPCHVKALHGPAAGPALLSLIPGLRVHTIDVSCSGMGGTWGLKAVNHDTSLAIGRRMLDSLNRPGVLFGSTECSSCRLQMQEGTGKRTLHPVEYLAYAYGLLPEIGAKLRKPLDDLVSD